jgi:hypothetical protein
MTTAPRTLAGRETRAAEQPDEADGAGKLERRRLSRCYADNSEVAAREAMWRRDAGGLTWFAKGVSASDARRAIPLDLLVYDAVGVVVTLQVVLSGVLNVLGLGHRRGVPLLCHWVGLRFV